MKKFPFFALLLLSFLINPDWVDIGLTTLGFTSADPPTSGWQKVKRTKANGSIERGWVRRELTLYPQTSSGNAAFEAAVNAGLFFIQTTDPFVTYTPPASVTGATGPGWASARYSLDTQLKIETTSEVVAIKTERNDGVLLSGSSPDLGGVNSGDFLNTVSQTGGTYNKVLRISWTPPPAGQSLRLTFKRSSGELYTQNVTVQANASGVVLFAPAVAPAGLSFQIVSYSCQTGVIQYRFVSPVNSPISVSMPGVFAGTVNPGVVLSHTFPGDGKTDRLVTVVAVQGSQNLSTSFTTSCELTSPGSGTVTPPPSTTVTGKYYTRVFVLGNSILKTTFDGGPARGMAASALEKDFVHLLTAKLQTVNPGVEVRGTGDFGTSLPNLDLSDGSYWEGNYYQLGTHPVYPGGLARFDVVAAWLNVPGALIIIRNGENITDPTKGLANAYKALIDRLNPTGTIPVVMSKSVWPGRETVNQIIEQVASERGYALAPLANVNGTAVQFHPDDTGHQQIADGLWAVIPAQSAPVTPPQPVPSTPAGWLTFSDDPGVWENDLATLQNGTVKVQFRKSIGGVPFWMGRQDLGRNYIQTHFWNNHWDPGRSYGGAWYAAPYAREYFVIDEGTPEQKSIGPDWGIGFNPVWGGSITPGDGSQVTKAAKVQTSDRGEVFCEQTIAKQWDFLGKPSSFTLNHEFWLAAPETVGHKMQVVIGPRKAGTSLPTKYTGWPQEEPGIYVPSKYHKRLVKINGQTIDLYANERNNPPNAYTDDGTISTYSDDLSEGITLYTPDNICMGSGRPTPPEFGENGEATDVSAGYMQGKQYRNAGEPGAWSQTIYTIIGSRQTALNRLASLPPLNSSFDFDFTDPMSLQHGWSSGNADLKRENGNYVFAVGQPHYDNGVSYQATLNSPFRRWAASSLPQLQFTMAVSSGLTELRLRWSKVGPNGQLQDFDKPFPVTGDNIERTYTVSTSDPNWSGTIVRVGLGPAVPPGGSMPAGAKLILKRIKKP